KFVRPGLSRAPDDVRPAGDGPRPGVEASTGWNKPDLAGPAVLARGPAGAPAYARTDGRLSGRSRFLPADALLVQRRAAVVAPESSPPPITGWSALQPDSCPLYRRRRSRR